MKKILSNNQNDENHKKGEKIMKKIILSLSFCIVSILILAACNNGGTSTNDASDNNENLENVFRTENSPLPEEPTGFAGFDSIDWSEPASFTWWTLPSGVNDYYTSFNDNPVTKFMEYHFNVTFDFDQPIAGSEGDALALIMGSGRYPDAINLATYSGSVTQLYEDGIIVNIAEWLDYMPNLSTILANDPEIARGTFDDDGRILTLPNFSEVLPHPWFGLMYRHDILETMTGGNVQFPSGNEGPTTIEDWEYMLPMFLEFFEMAGFEDHAPLILPANPAGMFHFGELKSAFGTYYLFYVRDHQVHGGMLGEGMFEYALTMRRWFENGWIHQDFLSQTQDMFFMPNPPLVFGGAAGSFNGMLMHLGDRMSMPEHDLFFDVRPAVSPVSEGFTQRDQIAREISVFDMAVGDAIYSGNPDIGRFLATMDFFYTEEGGLLRAVGIREEQITPNATEIMERMGLSTGSYSFDDAGRIVFSPLIDDGGGHILRTAVSGLRFPGLSTNRLLLESMPEEVIEAAEIWGAQDSVSEVFRLPIKISPTVEESAILNANEARFTDLINQMMAGFITGTVELNEATWADFQNQLIDLGYEENRQIWQTAYDRYINRGQ